MLSDTVRRNWRAVMLGDTVRQTAIEALRAHRSLLISVGELPEDNSQVARIDQALAKLENEPQYRSTAIDPATAEYDQVWEVIYPDGRTEMVSGDGKPVSQVQERTDLQKPSEYVPLADETVAWANLTIENGGGRWRYGIDYNDATDEYRRIDEIDLPDDIRLCQLQEGPPLVEMTTDRVIALLYFLKISSGGYTNTGIAPEEHRETLRQMLVEMGDSYAK